MKKRRAYIGFIAPGFIIYTIFMIIPIGCAVYYSFFNWSGIGPMEFIGLGNFKKLFTDVRMSRIFFNALKNNMKYLLCVMLIITPLQIFLAYVIYIKVRGHKYIRLMLFLPYVISTTIVGFFAIILLDPNIGLFNEILGAIGGQSAKKAWLGDPNMVFKIFVCAIIWQCIGAGMMIFYANMQEIPSDIIEASVIDGAGECKKFFYVVLPMMKSSLTTNITTSVIYALTMFDLPYILVGPQGGVNNKLDFVNMVFYRYAFGGSYFGETSIGFGSSISVTMFVIIMTFSLVTSRFLRRLNE
ncbi:MAG: sugar ABC transporter permease [Candidatus Limivivens sp.]|nr:sugar ABC transporter permease [Candidatus Limivivens sp.]